MRNKNRYNLQEFFCFCSFNTKFYKIDFKKQVADKAYIKLNKT